MNKETSESDTSLSCLPSSLQFSIQTGGVLMTCYCERRDPVRGAAGYAELYWETLVCMKHIRAADGPNKVI